MNKKDGQDQFHSPGKLLVSEKDEAFLNIQGLNLWSGFAYSTQIKPTFVLDYKIRHILLCTDVVSGVS